MAWHRDARRLIGPWCLWSCVLACLSAAAAEPVGSLPETLAKGVPAGTIVPLDSSAGPVVSDLTAENLRGEAGKPVVIRGVGQRRAVIRGRFRLRGAAHVTLERLTFEPDTTDGTDQPWVDLEGDHITIRDCTIRGVPGDGLRLVGASNVVEGGEVAAGEGYGLMIDGSARFTACASLPVAGAEFGSVVKF